MTNTKVRGKLLKRAKASRKKNKGHTAHATHSGAQATKDIQARAFSRLGKQDRWFRDHDNHVCIAAPEKRKCVLDFKTSGIFAIRKDTWREVVSSSNAL